MPWWSQTKVAKLTNGQLIPLWNYSQIKDLEAQAHVCLTEWEMPFTLSLSGSKKKNPHCYSWKLEMTHSPAACLCSKLAPPPLLPSPIPSQCWQDPKAPTEDPQERVCIDGWWSQNWLQGKSRWLLQLVPTTKSAGRQLDHWPWESSIESQNPRTVWAWKWP